MPTIFLNFVLFWLCSLLVSLVLMLYSSSSPLLSLQMNSLSLAHQCWVTLQGVLPAPYMHIWNCFCFSHTILQHSKVYQARLLPYKTNLTSLPEFDGCAGEPRDKASWLVEDWALKHGPYLLGTHATQQTLPNRPTSTTTVLNVDSVLLQRESACLDLLWIYESIQ